MATASTPRISPEEYLQNERHAEHRSEYLQGQVFSMAGGSYNHSLIIGNVFGEIRQGLKKSGCRALPNDTRLGVVDAELYTYPDVMVICGEPVFLDNRKDTVLNPVLIAEVLSQSTESYDRGAKFELYRGINSLREYITVAQNKVHVVQYVRDDATSWLPREYAGAKDRVKFVSVPLEIEIGEFYEEVRFETN